MTARDEVFGHDHEQWRWCLHCGRVYPASKYRTEIWKLPKLGKLGGETAVLKMCPYEGCDGSTVLDGMPWGLVRQENPSYPLEPVEGVVYPLYPRRDDLTRLGIG